MFLENNICNQFSCLDVNVKVNITMQYWNICHPSSWRILIWLTGKILTDPAYLQCISLSRSDLSWISQWIFWVWVGFFSGFSVWFVLLFCFCVCFFVVIVIGLLVFLLHIIVPICWLGLSEHWRDVDTLTMLEVIDQWLREWSICFTTV